MIVKCLNNDEEKLPDGIRKFAYGQTQGKLPFTLQKKYIVYGIRRTLDNEFYFLISDDDELWHKPWWYPSTLFEIVESQKDSSWVEFGNKYDAYFTFPEYKDDEFKEKIEDGDINALQQFEKYYVGLGQ